jgi:hypothetical protein
MAANLALRRQLYGEDALCGATLDMVAVADSVGAVAKFCGSGGAAVACCPAGSTQAAKLQGALPTHGLLSCMSRGGAHACNTAHTSAGYLQPLPRALLVPVRACAPLM